MSKAHLNVDTDELPITMEPPENQQFKVSTRFQDYYPPGFLRKVVAEVVATFLLVFVTCGAAALTTSDEHKVSHLGASLVSGLIVTVMIYTVGHVSGAHMNPAVTIAFATVRHFPWKQVPFYAGAQLIGSISASFALKVLFQPIKHFGTTTPSGTDLQALIMEIIVTFTMMFVTSAVATDSKAVGELAGIAVGSSVCITSILAGPVSGGSMNPARTIGPAIASNVYKSIWVYIVGPITGTLSGAIAMVYIVGNLASIVEKVIEGRLRWFGHVRRRDTTAVVRRVEAIVVDGTRRRGRPRRKWIDRARMDLKSLELSEDMTSDRREWRHRIRVVE